MRELHKKSINLEIIEDYHGEVVSKHENDENYDYEESVRKQLEQYKEKEVIEKVPELCYHLVCAMKVV